MEFDRSPVEWDRAATEGIARSMAFRKVAIEVYRSDPASYRTVGELLHEFVKDDFEHDRYDGSLEILEALIESGYQSPTAREGDLMEAAGVAAYSMNNFQEAKRRWEQAIQKNGKLKVYSDKILGTLDQLADEWAKERAIREAEAKADDLPRVRLYTNKGIFTIELFENEAPETVANFIYLTEKGYFNEKRFFRVLPALVAQTGCDRGDGTGSPGYSIHGEMKHADARRHYRGSLAMALGSDPVNQRPLYDSAGSQFYICMLPLPHLNGEYCVFGRVLEGIEKLGNITKVDLSTEEGKKEGQGKFVDLIIRAEVVRKRSHDYLPKPVSGELLK
jgi:cyclophilin family peptidyl-prolyl cis-trans isomerase